MKSIRYNISYHTQFYDEFGKISQIDHEDSNLLVNTIIGK
jgi:hypothetical protein